MKRSKITLQIVVVLAALEFPKVPIQGQPVASLPMNARPIQSQSNVKVAAAAIDSSATNTVVTLDGTTYHRAKVVLIRPDGLSVKYATDNGDIAIAKIATTNLPVELQRKFGADIQSQADELKHEEKLKVLLTTHAEAAAKKKLEDQRQAQLQADQDSLQAAQELKKSQLEQANQQSNECRRLQTEVMQAEQAYNQAVMNYNDMINGNSPRILRAGESFEIRQSVKDRKTAYDSAVCNRDDFIRKNPQLFNK